MIGATYAAASGLINNQNQMAVLANNLSNINTVGFKEDRISFQVDPKNIDAKSRLLSKNGQQYYLSLKPLTKIDFTSGNIKHTGNNLDVILEGNGFFCIQTLQGVQYTKAGNFTLNSDNVLVTQEGLPVLGRSGDITVDDRDFNIDDKGNIYVDGNQVDRLKIVDFPQPYPLKKAGNTLFALSDPGVDEQKAENVMVKQGFVELSNVDSISMMTEMIEVLRGAESYQKIIQYLGDASSKAINEVGRLA